MRAIVITALGLAAAIPAWAGSAGIGYLGLRGSYVSAEDQGVAAPDIDVEARFDKGWGVSGVMGFVISESLRGEIEAGYAINGVKNVQILRNDIMPASEGSVVPMNGQVDFGTAMFNLYYDFPIADLPFLPWVGVGAGGAYVNYSGTYDYGDPADLVVVKDSDWQFAYQLMAGVTVPVAETTSVTLGYRYFGTEDMVFVAADGAEIETQLTNHALDLGIQFHL